MTLDFMAICWLYPLAIFVIIFLAWFIAEKADLRSLKMYAQTVILGVLIGIALFFLSLGMIVFHLDSVHRKKKGLRNCR